MAKVDFSYNILLHHPTLNALRAIFSIYHLRFKFSTPGEASEVCTDVQTARECYLAALQAAISRSSSILSSSGSRTLNALTFNVIEPQETKAAIYRGFKSQMSCF